MPVSHRLQLYVGPEHPCGYLPQRAATNLFVDPRAPMSPILYGRLLERGFRRSGAYVYRPYCPACRSCVPVRLPAATFRPHRWARRVLRCNSDISTSLTHASLSDEAFALYRLYQRARHPAGGMDQDSVEDVNRFLFSDWSETWSCEFRLAGQLVAVAVVDCLPDALSAVYTFFDPRLPERGLGNLAILHEIQQALDRGLRWLYLGYWIGESDKMNYKARFQPLQAFCDERWLSFDQLTACSPLCDINQRTAS